MKMIRYLFLSMMLLCRITTWGQDGFNPANPPEPDPPPGKTTPLTLVADPAGAGSLSGAGNYLPGTEVKVTASPSTNFQFVNWTLGDEEISTERSFTFTKGEGSDTLVAHFVYNPGNPGEPNEPDIQQPTPTYALTVVAEEGGNSPRGSGIYESGTQVEISVSVNTGFTFLGWYNEAGELLSSNRTFTYTIQERAEVITARFSYTPGNPSEPSEPDIPDKPISHQIIVTATPADGGTVSVENATVNEGERTRVRAAANTGFVFQGWYVADTLFNTAADFYYTMGTEDISMEARFYYNPSNPSEPQESGNKSYTFYLTSVRGLPGRTVQYPVYLSSLDSLTNMQFNITFPQGLTPDIDNIRLSGKATGYTLTVNEVSGNEGAGAPRRAIDRESTYQFLLTGGKLPACNTRLMVIDVAIAENVTDTAQQVKINQVVVTDTEGTNTAASTRNGNLVLNASSGDGTYYYLTLISTGSGQVTVNSRTVRNSIYVFDLLEGSSVNVYFVPDEGYRISSVKIGETDITADAYAYGRYLLENINSDMELTVEFAEGSSAFHALTVKASGNGIVTYDGQDVRDEETVFSVAHGSQAELTITPDAGNRIRQVLLNGTEDVTDGVVDGKYTIASMTTAVSVEASFEQLFHDVTISHEGNLVTMTADINSIWYVIADTISTPTPANGIRYTGPFSVERNGVVSAAIYIDGVLCSDIVTMTVDWFKASNVTFSQNGYVLSMNTDTDGATIRYVMSGSGTGEQTYLEPLTLTGDCTIEAYATREGYNNSDTTRYVFVAVDVTVAKPVISHEGNVISISCNTEHAVVHYTMDGSDPTAESPVYTGSFEVNENVTIKAVALRENWFASAVVTLDVDWISAGNAVFDGLVLTVGENTTMQSALDLVGGRDVVLPTLAAIVWKSDRTISNSDMQGIENPNLLLYVSNKALAPGNVKNIVVGDSLSGYKAQQIVLTETESGNGNFYCPIAFTANRITYQREFRQQTETGKCRGWETIVLPFTVQSIMHERNGQLRPFAAEGSGRPFWLREMGSNGFVDAKQMEANKAYVISMPNEPGRFDADYQQGGRVTFSSYGCQVPVTSRETSGSQAIRFIPALSAVAQSDSVYALNVGEEYAVGATIYDEGSIFVAGWSDVRPFHCYTQHTASSPAPRYMPLSGWLDGSTTNISEKVIVNSEEFLSEESVARNATAPVYNLKGQRVAQPTKGIYIMNGKKVKK